MYGFRADKEASIGGYVKMLWDDKYIYVAAKLYDKDVTGFATERDARLWMDGDVFEFFVKPSEESYQYYEIHVSPKNTQLDMMFPRRGAGGGSRFTPYDAKMKSGAYVKGTLNNWRDTDEYWSVEMKIPFKSFEAAGRKAPEPGDVWRFAGCRYNYSVTLPADMPRAKELSSTARHLDNFGFHNYEKYNYLKFEK